MVCIAVPGERQVVDDDVVSSQLGERLRDQVFTGRTGCPDSGLGSWGAPGGKPADAHEQRNGKGPLQRVQRGQHVEHVLRDRYAIGHGHHDQSDHQEASPWPAAGRAH